jgi:hypothetical protein
MNEFPIPGFLPSASGPIHDPGKAVLDVYAGLASARRQAEDARKLAEAQIRSIALEADAVIAELSAMRFEFDRLLHRIGPQLEKIEAGGILSLLDLFSRGWSALLQRHCIEIHDPKGEVFSDALAEIVEVRAAFVDPEVKQPMIAETIAPVIRYKGRLASKAVVHKAVPPNLFSNDQKGE